MKISIIAAIGQNNEIGLNNKLLWKSKSDLEHFKQLTLGKPIIMGRKTFESLPCILPGRKHAVITSDVTAYEDQKTDEVSFFPSMQEALDVLHEFFNPDEIFIIGGASIYEQALPLADELHISHMDWTGEADTFFPTIDLDIWKRVGQLGRHPTMDDPLNWTYKRYQRK